MKGIETIHEDASKPESTASSMRSDSEAKLAETKEINGPKGPEPTRFGDWERKGRCVDF